MPLSVLDAIGLGWPETSGGGADGGLGGEAFQVGFELVAKGRVGVLSATPLARSQHAADRIAPGPACTVQATLVQCRRPTCRVPFRDQACMNLPASQSGHVVPIVEHSRRFIHPITASRRPASNGH